MGTPSRQGAPHSPTEVSQRAEFRGRRLVCGREPGTRAPGRNAPAGFLARGWPPSPLQLEKGGKNGSCHLISMEALEIRTIKQENADHRNCELIHVPLHEVLTLHALAFLTAVPFPHSSPTLLFEETARTGSCL